MDLPRKPSISLPDSVSEKVKAIVDPLMLTDGQIERVMEIFYKEMWLGMSKDPEQRKLTSLQMEDTYVRTLLDGTEHGDFLALDLGGTNFRVLMCQMRNGKCESISRNYNVPTEKLRGPAVGVFDHLADSIYKFLKEEKVLDRRFPLGFTFSFPMIQEGIKKGVLVTWTKSFACPDGVGQDAVKLLEDSLAKHTDVKVDVVAVLNDTTGTLMAGSYLDKHCEIGLIMGTGCNAAYVEDVVNIEKWTGNEEDPFKQTVIDMECGAFGDNGSLDFAKTQFDKVIDAHSNHVGSFTFEKLFSGHYIGDLARLVLLELTNQNLVFSGKASEKLRQWNTFTAEHLSYIERDTDDNMDHTKKMLSDLDLTEVTSADDISVIRYVCSALSIRAAQLVSAALAVLLKHMKRPQMTVAIDGSLYRHHPKVHNIMMSWLSHLAPDTKQQHVFQGDRYSKELQACVEIPDEKYWVCDISLEFFTTDIYILASVEKTTLIDAIDGSGRGAAFVAAVAVKTYK